MNCKDFRQFLNSPRHTRQPSVNRKCTLDKNSKEKHVANYTVKNGYKSAFSRDTFIRLDASGHFSSKSEKNISCIFVYAGGYYFISQPLHPVHPSYESTSGLSTASFPFEIPFRLKLSDSSWFLVFIRRGVLQYFSLLFVSDYKECPFIGQDYYSIPRTILTLPAVNFIVAVSTYVLFYQLAIQIS